ncbi:MAG TPA: hypothetical protein VM864_12650 [Pyrinomonadaceae bacterium]|nr:hypothetical protein [Pyrinomonadaceae bacterium]
MKARINTFVHSHDPLCYRQPDALDPRPAGIHTVDVKTLLREKARDEFAQLDIVVNHQNASAN